MHLLLPSVTYPVKVRDEAQHSKGPPRAFCLKACANLNSMPEEIISLDSGVYDLKPSTQQTLYPLKQLNSAGIATRYV